MEITAFDNGLGVLSGNSTEKKKFTQASNKNYALWKTKLSAVSKVVSLLQNPSDFALGMPNIMPLAQGTKTQWE